MAVIDTDDIDTLDPRDEYRGEQRLERRLRDYVGMTRTLGWQRQALFLGAALLAAAYYSASIAFATYAAIVATDVVDHVLAWKVTHLRNGEIDVARGRRLHHWILANTVLNALAICTFIFSMAMQQPVGGHFTPMVILFASALFAAMHNHQLVLALVVRLSIYGVTFLAIGLLDIIRVRPPLESVLWLQFFSTLFVAYFIIDCSSVFLQFYRNKLIHIEALTREHRRTKAAYQAKSEFVSTVSHELRTPLTSIKGALDVINTGMLGRVPPKMRPMLDLAGRNAARLAALINDILDLQKIEAGVMTYRFDKIEVGELLSEALAENTGLAEGQLVRMIITQTRNEPLYVRGDEARLMQVLTNMLSNAIKFSNTGDRVRCGYRKAGDTVRIFVSDEGIGIPDEAREKVFEKFTQVDGSDMRQVGGTGLGMNISRQIVEQHGGVIDYISVEGKGTTFFIDLNLIDEDDD